MNNLGIDLCVKQILLVIDAVIMSEHTKHQVEVKLVFATIDICFSVLILLW